MQATGAAAQASIEKIGSIDLAATDASTLAAQPSTLTACHPVIALSSSVLFPNVYA